MDFKRPEEVIKKIIVRAVRETNKTYYGNVNAVNQIKELKPSMDFQHLFFSNCLFSRYPKTLETKKIREAAYFILKRRNENNNIPNLSNKQLYLYLCDYLDKQPKIKELEVSK